MIEGVVFNALNGLVGGRCYPEFPEPPAIAVWPAIRYVVIDGVSTPTILGTDTVDTDDTRVQIDAVAKSLGAALALRDQIITAMQSTYPPCTRANYAWERDVETRTWRVRLDFIFNPSSQATS
jgi:hypothetical protein